MLILMQATTKAIGENINNPDPLKVLFTTAHLLLQIWYALNAVEIPAVCSCLPSTTTNNNRLCTRNWHT
jgi:hypothetical protein